MPRVADVFEPCPFFCRLESSASQSLFSCIESGIIGRPLGYSTPSAGLGPASFDCHRLPHSLSLGLVTQITLAGRLEIPLASADRSSLALGR